MPGNSAFKAKGITIGAIFFTTLVTDLTTFLTAFLTFLKTFFSQPNSARPVSGLIELAEEPTTYCSGSSTPRSSKCRKMDSLILGLPSINGNGMIISPVATWAIVSSPPRPYEAIRAATSPNSAIPAFPKACSASSRSRAAISSSSM